MLTVECTTDAIVSLQGGAATHGQDAAVESVFTPADNSTFFGLLMTAFGTTEEPKVLSVLPRRPITVVMLETRISKRLAERSANQLALNKLLKQQSKLQTQLDCDADSLNAERQFFHLPVPTRRTEGNYAFESFTFSSVEPSAMVDLHASINAEQATASLEDSDAEKV